MCTVGVAKNAIRIGEKMTPSAIASGTVMSIDEFIKTCVQGRKQSVRKSSEHRDCIGKDEEVLCNTFESNAEYSLLCSVYQSNKNSYIKYV